MILYPISFAYAAPISHGTWISYLDKFSWVRRECCLTQAHVRDVLWSWSAKHGVCSKERVRFMRQPHRRWGRDPNLSSWTRLEADLKNKVRRGYTYSLILIHGVWLDSLGTKQGTWQTAGGGKVISTWQSLIGQPCLCPYLVWAPDLSYQRTSCFLMGSGWQTTAPLLLKSRKSWFRCALEVSFGSPGC